MHKRFLLAFLMLICGISGWGSADPAMPWELRNHYTFNAKNSAFDYAEDNGAWRVRIKDKLLIREAQFDITLGDGTVIHSRDLGSGSSSRDEATAFLGAGFAYTVTFNDLHGLNVVHTARTIQGRPFVLVEIDITNKTSEPVVLKSVRPVITEDGAIMNFGENALYRNRHLTTRGGMAVFDKGAAPSMSIFHDPDQDVTIGIYVFDKSEGKAEIRFQPSNGSWAGDVVCSYEPGLVLQPGQRIKTEPVVVIFGYPSPNKMELYTAWAYGMYMARAEVKEGPRGLAGAPEGAPLDAVLASARPWKGNGVDHALIPYGWEEKPGNQRGGNGYPKNIGNAAGVVSKEGFGAGLTIDPLPVEKAKEGVVAGPDGILWANPAHPHGRGEVATRLRQLVIGNKFAFAAIAPSRVPDSVLAQFGISRAQADNLAMDIAAETIRAVPVFPAGGRAVPPTREAFLEAASAAGRLKTYGGRFAPLRVDMNAGGNVDDHTAQALRLWPGPVEFIGSPKGGAVKTLSAGMSPVEYGVGAVDLHHTVSHVWQVLTTHSSGNPTPFGTALTVFPGAKEWHIADIDLDTDKAIRLWNPQNGQFINSANGAVGTSGEWRNYGAVAVSDHPVMLGVSGGEPSLYLNRLQNHAWNAGTATLSGNFTGGLPSNGKAFVHVPAPWKFKSGEVGKSRVRVSEEGEIISFGMGGSSNRFELQFQR